MEVHGLSLRVQGKGGEATRARKPRRLVRRPKTHYAAIMDITELTEDETLAMIALLREVVKADGDYSMEEQAAVREIRQTLGAERFDATIERVKNELPDRAAVKAHAKTVSRQAARWAIWELLVDVARADEITEEEEKPLVWLASWWKLNQNEKPR